MAISQTDKAFLADANTRLGKKYKTIDDYLTDNGRRKEGSEGYNRRNAALQNWRGTTTRTEFTQSGDWLPYITEKYGWIVNIYNSNPEVAQIIKDAYVNGWSDEKFTQAINSSKWFAGLQAGEYDYLKGTATNDRAYLDKIDATAATAKSIAAKSGYTLSDADANLLAAGQLKGQWDMNRFTQEVGKKITTAATTGGAVTATTPAATTPTGLQTGNDAATIRAKAQSYGLKLTDSQIEGYVQAAVNGTLTTQQIEGQFREQAKALYPSIAKQLDAGNLDAATSAYRSTAATVLGIDPSSVDFTDSSKFGKLLTYQDPNTGDHRLMNSTEWSAYLRSLPDWQNTKEAKNGYANAINTVEKIFGRVR